MASFVHTTTVGPEFFNRLLAQAFEFNFPDLAKNREGRMARDQWHRLVRKTVTPLVRAIVGSVALFIAYIFLARLIGQGGWAQTLQIAVLMTLAAGTVKFSMHAALLIGDLYRGKVALAEGRLEPSWCTDRAQVNRHETGSRTVFKHRFAVGGEQFDVPESAFRILTDNFEAGLPTVRVYYTPASRIILSIEAFAVEELVLRPEQTKKKRKPVSIWKS